MNKKFWALIAVAIIITIGGTAAYNNSITADNSLIDAKNSTINASNSTITADNSTIIAGENNTIIMPSPLPTVEPKPTLEPSPTPAPVKTLEISYSEAYRNTTLKYSYEIVGGQTAYINIPAGEDMVFLTLAVTVKNTGEVVAPVIDSHSFYLTVGGVEYLPYEGYMAFGYLRGATEWVWTPTVGNSLTTELRFNVPENTTEYILGYGGELGGFTINWL